MKLTKESLELELLVSRKTVKQVAEENGYTEKSVYALMSRLGVKRPFKYSLNTEKLFNSSDPVTNYLAGLIATDGYLNPKHSRIELQLIGLSEKELLQNILDYFESDAKVAQYKYKYNTEGRYGIGLAADGIREFFSTNFNIPVENKTDTVGVPSSFYSEDCARAYILGCFDGDGSMNVNGPRLSILAKSESFISGIRDIIAEYTGIRISISDTRGYPSLYYQHGSVVKVSEWMYTNAPLCLERKYQKFLNLLQVSNSTTKAPGLLG